MMFEKKKSAAHWKKKLELYLTKMFLDFSLNVCVFVTLLWQI